MIPGIQYCKNLSTYSLLLLGPILLGSLVGVFILLGSLAGASIFQASNTMSAALVQVIATSRWNPPSPDPSGITYWPAHDTLLISDAEVDEMPRYFTGDNLFEATLAGSLGATYSTTSFSIEPTGVTVNPANGHFFFSDDDQQKVFEVDLGPDQQLGTGDDAVTSFNTQAFGSTDPEGIAFGNGKLYISDGAGAEVYIVSPGANGRFDGVAPEGDDQVTHFDVSRWVRATEGIEFNPDDGLLYILNKHKDRRSNDVVVTTTAGRLVSRIDISFLNTLAPAGLTFAPGSQNRAVKNLYIIGRGIDNRVDPDENDGEIYEITLGESPLPQHFSSDNSE